MDAEVPFHGLRVCFRDAFPLISRMDNRQETRLTRGNEYRFSSFDCDVRYFLGFSRRTSKRFLSIHSSGIQGDRGEKKL